MPTIAELEARAEQFRQEIAALKGTQTVTSPPAAEAPPPVRLDLGCGPNKKPGFLGVDTLDFPGVDVRLDIGRDKWPWADSLVDEVHTAHTLEHIAWKETDYALVDGKLVKSVLWPRAHVFNELWRVLKPGARATIVVPHWASCRHWGDPTHEAHPLSEMSPWYLNRGWRNSDAPHTNSILTCDFDCTTPGYSWHKDLDLKNEVMRQFAIRWYREAAQDMMFTLLCRK